MKSAKILIILIHRYAHQQYHETWGITGIFGGRARAAHRFGVARTETGTGSGAGAGAGAGGGSILGARFEGGHW